MVEESNLRQVYFTIITEDWLLLVKEQDKGYLLA